MNKNDDEYSKYLKDKKVVVVGPAPSIIGAKGGKDIDSYDVVVRINKAIPIPSKLYEDIGSRCDILYNCLNADPECGGKINFNKCKEIGIQYICCPYPPISPFKSDINKFIKINKNNFKFHHIDTKYYNSVANNIKTRPNSGIGTILDLLKHDIKELYITGFTFFKGGYYSEYRQYNEKQVLSKMIKAGNHSQIPQINYMRNIFLNDDRVKLDNELKKILNIT